MKISVIIPTYNEEKYLACCIESIRAQTHPAEIIVADGGSEDSTLAVAHRLTEMVLNIGEKNLSQQFNKAASVASGEVFLFLHADTVLTTGIFKQLEVCFDQVEFIGGAFKMKLNGKRSFYRILETGGDLYCRFSKTYFGDRGIFICADIFKQMGGFRDLPIMADVDFSRRMNSLGKTVLLPGPLITSSRKFDHENPLHSLYKIFWALMAYRMGYPLENIREKYYGRKAYPAK